MNLPNLLTSLRFVMIPIYIAVFASGHMIPAFFVVVAAGITDVLDGYIARRTGQITQLGSMLDPLADKLMLITVFVSLLVTKHIPLLAALAMFVRDVLMIVAGILAHIRGMKTVPANWMGKLTTVLMYVAIMMIFFGLSYAITLLWVVIVFSFVTLLVYIGQFRKLNMATPVKKVN
ncbi:CDP-alcohol phosphatidyltransferase family protein [Paenibacillus yanchengensis]|uniref:CDP-diacylglycerol--glycerol-3-phosphate 3-phosphatidyltransferase n=1 Tax=Paenibacillus yanchengensis TaxID=2035833 RepID=A0ABW4YMU7_9BACL